MFSRRHFLTAFLVAGFGCLSPQIGSAQSLNKPTESEISQKLPAKLVCETLYAKTKKEKEFIERVVAMRDSGKLPFRVFYGAYRYAMQKTKTRRFYYFEQALLRLCKEEGISLTPAERPGNPAYSI